MLSALYLMIFFLIIFSAESRAWRFADLMADAIFTDVFTDVLIGILTVHFLHTANSVSCITRIRNRYVENKLYFSPSKLYHLEPGTGMQVINCTYATVSRFTFARKGLHTEYSAGLPQTEYNSFFHGI